MSTGKTWLDFIVRKNTQDLLQDEVYFLRKQVESLQETIKSLTEKPKLEKNNPDFFRPKKYDAVSERYVAKTDKEIHEERQALESVGVV